jgi:hypothetical protein
MLYKFHKFYSLVNAVGRSYGPVLVQQRRPTLVQVRGSPPLSQGYLPGPFSERRLLTTDDPAFRIHPSTAHCRQQQSRT